MVQLVKTALSAKMNQPFLASPTTKIAQLIKKGQRVLHEKMVQLVINALTRKNGPTGRNGLTSENSLTG